MKAACRKRKRINRVKATWLKLNQYVWIQWKQRSYLFSWHCKVFVVVLPISGHPPNMWGDIWGHTQCRNPVQYKTDEMLIPNLHIFTNTTKACYTSNITQHTLVFYNVARAHRILLLLLTSLRRAGTAAYHELLVWCPSPGLVHQPTWFLFRVLFSSFMSRIWTSFEGNCLFSRVLMC